MTWLQFIIAILTLGLVNGGFFYSINRKMKKTELKEKEIEVMRKQDDEWRALYQEQCARRTEMEKRCEELALKNELLNRSNSLLELGVQKLTWYRCTVNHCEKRRPPHIFDIEGNELEAVNKNNERTEL